MANPNLVNVGDLVVERGHVGIAVEVSPVLQVAGILESADAQNGLQLGLPGTVTEPVEVIGAIPLSEIADSLIMNDSGVPAALGRDRVLDALHESAAKGPIEHPQPVDL